MEYTTAQLDYRLYTIELRWYWQHAFTADAIFTVLPTRAKRLLAIIAGERGCRSFTDLCSIVSTDLLRYRGCGVSTQLAINKALQYNTALEQYIDTMEYID